MSVTTKTATGTGEKRCSKCGRVRKNSEFVRCKNHPDGYSYDCKSCRRIYKETHISVETIRASRRKYNKTEKGRAARKGRSASWQKLHFAVKNGEIYRPENCSNCGKKCFVHGHHPSYEAQRALDVVWLCPSCHKAAHAEGGSI
jgi:hypothetical protein